MFNYRNYGGNNALWHSSYPYIIINLNMLDYGLLKSKLNWGSVFLITKGPVKIALIQFY